MSSTRLGPRKTLKPEVGHTSSARGWVPAGPENGWQSEDVTDVQDMGDFDFEEGLKKFDKTSFSKGRNVPHQALARRVTNFDLQPPIMDDAPGNKAPGQLGQEDKRPKGQEVKRTR